MYKREFSHKVFGWGQASGNLIYTVWCWTGYREGRMRVAHFQREWFFYLAFENENDGRKWKHDETLFLIKYKEQNICFKLVHFLMEKFTTYSYKVMAMMRNEMYTNADLKMSLYVWIHTKTIPWKFCFLNP